MLTIENPWLFPKPLTLFPVGVKVCIASSVVPLYIWDCPLPLASPVAPIPTIGLELL